MKVCSRENANVAAVGTATAVSLLGDGILYSALPSVYEKIGLRPIQVGILLSVNRWIRVFTNRWAARTVDRMDRRFLFTVSLAVMSLVTFSYAVLDGGWFAVAVLSRLLWGVCWSFIRQLGLVVVKEIGSTSSLGQRTGLYEGIARTGTLVGYVLGGAGVDTIGFQATLLATGAVSLCGAPLGFASYSRVARNRVEGGGHEFLATHIQEKISSLESDDEDGNDEVKPWNLWLDSDGDGEDGETLHEAQGSAAAPTLAREPSASPDDAEAEDALLSDSGAEILPATPGITREESMQSLRLFLIVSCLQGMAGLGILVSTLGRMLRDAAHGADDVSIWGAHIGVASTTGLFMSIRWAAELVAGPVVGRYGDRVGRRTAAGQFIATGLVASVLCIFVGSHILTLLIGSAVVFVAAAGSAVNLNSAANLQGNLVLAAFLTAQDVGTALGPLLSWFLLEMGVASSWLFAVMAAAYTACLVLLPRALSDR